MRFAPFVILDEARDLQVAIIIERFAPVLDLFNVAKHGLEFLEILRRRWRGFGLSMPHALRWPSARAILTEERPRQ